MKKSTVFLILLGAVALNLTVIVHRLSEGLVTPQKLAEANRIKPISQQRTIPIVRLARQARPATLADRN